MIHINNSKNVSMSERDVEVVERKGFGHPDTICDSVVNHVAEQLKDKYLKECGTIYHYNMDKALLTAGVSAVDFGRKHRLAVPIKLLLGDRATFVNEFNVSKFIEEAAYDWFKDNIRNLHENDIVIRNVAMPGSEALVDIFNRDNITANDTSATVGYAPLSWMEKSILMLENYLQKTVAKHEPAIGQDIKIMGIRTKDKVDLTVATAIIAEEVSNVADYINVIELIQRETFSFFGGRAKVTVNALDDYSRGIGGLYLTNTGLSAESADSGQVGRGNNPLGVIPLNRPMSAEAEAGKNDTSHVGKIYNLMCYDIANNIYDVLNPDEVYVWMVSQIGKPLNEPNLVSVEITGHKPDKEVIENIINEKLSEL